MSLELTGKIIQIYPTQHVSDKFRKREVIIELKEEINGNTYTNFAKMQLVQNKCDLLDKYKVNDVVNVKFNIKGNKWERDSKINYITTLDIWKIEYADSNYSAQVAPLQPYNDDIGTADDLPF